MIGLFVPYQEKVLTRPGSSGEVPTMEPSRARSDTYQTDQRNIPDGKPVPTPGIYSASDAMREFAHMLRARAESCYKNSTTYEASRFPGEAMIQRDRACTFIRAAMMADDMAAQLASGESSRAGPTGVEATGADPIRSGGTTQANQFRSKANRP